MAIVQAPAAATTERPPSAAALPPPVNKEPSLVSLQGGESSYTADFGLSPHSMLPGLRPAMQRDPMDAAGAAGGLKPPPLLPAGVHVGVDAVPQESKDTAQQFAPAGEAAPLDASSGGGSLAYVLTPIDNSLSQW